MAKKPELHDPTRRKPRLTEAAIHQALVTAKGLKSVAAEILGCDPSTIYRRVNASEKLQAVIAEQREALVDVAELSLHNAVAGGEAWAVCFALKCLGKDRGFVEKQEVHHSGKVDGPTNRGPAVVNISFRVVTRDGATIDPAVLAALESDADAGPGRTECGDGPVPAAVVVPPQQEAVPGLCGRPGVREV